MEVMPEAEILPPSLQRVWELRVEGLSVRAIAEQLHEPEERVRWQLGRAMARLERKDPLGILSKQAR